MADSGTTTNNAWGFYFKINLGQIENKHNREKNCYTKSFWDIKIINIEKQLKK